MGEGSRSLGFPANVSPVSGREASTGPSQPGAGRSPPHRGFPCPGGYLGVTGSISGVASREISTPDRLFQTLVR